MMISAHNIYTLQTDSRHAESAVHIETVITGGLYRFTILGMQNRCASDTKDRVYSALRSSNLLNLKSDNRKILVNLSPDNTEKKEGIYDLGIAISIMTCINSKIQSHNMLVIGGLSITGKIIPTKRLKQAIYTAYKNNISYIVCGTEDISSITQEIQTLLERNNIYIIHAYTLHEVIEKLHDFNVNQNTPTYHSTKITVEFDHDTFEFEKMDAFTQALFIAISGGHHILIQTPFNKSIKDICFEIGNMQLEKAFGLEIYRSFDQKSLDTDVHVCNTYIENIKLMSKENILYNQSLHKNSVIALYASCPCGYKYSFFNPHLSEKRCICSKRTLIQHQRYIESNFFEHFTMHIINSNTDFASLKNFKKHIDRVRQYQFNRHIQEHNLTDKEIFLFSDNSYLNQHREISKIERTLSVAAQDIPFDTEHKVNTLRIAQTIQDIFDCNEKLENTIKKPAISKQALILAISFVPRMDS